MSSNLGFGIYVYKTNVDPPRCRLLIYLGNYSKTVNLPTNLIKSPDFFERRYGFLFFEDCLIIKYGKQGQNLKLDDKVIITLPWKELTLKRYSFYDYTGTEVGNAVKLVDGKSYTNVDLVDILYEVVAKVHFSFLDYDRTPVISKSYVREMEYHQGTGVFSFLNNICKPIINRFINIQFDKETGPGKNTPKGGITSIVETIKSYDDAYSGFYEYASENGFSNIKIMPIETLESMMNQNRCIR